MLPTTTLTLADGVRIVVPDSLHLITSYVLREQQDWFEDEIKFLRRLLRPGQKVIDIGANHGVYTLSMARRVGAAGRVWAFEPASRTAALLAASIAANGFGQIVLEQSALSADTGTARLFLNDNSELNSLAPHDHGGESESVPLVTLDERMAFHGWNDIDFVKIDAEGEETNILRGGAVFFARESPLVQFEVKDGEAFHLELVQRFAELGYHAYRLVPGLDLLAPFDARTDTDAYLLNLFCCKPDRATQLARAGFLLEALPECAATAANDTTWRDHLEALPYGRILAEQWRASVADGQYREVAIALSDFVRARNPDLPMAERFAALTASHAGLRRLCETHPDHLRLASLARVAREFGARAQAAQALARLCNMIFQQKRVDPGEPFLAPGARFDGIAPRADIGTWVAAAALEEFERCRAFSSFYTGQAGLPQLRMIRDLGYGDDEMRRRLELTQRRFGLSAPT